ncbi:MAG: macro domain-containing protein [Sideroxydans sp.]
MIHDVSGDILLSGAKAIVQGVAPNDDCMHGLALQLRERLPAMYKDFRHYCQTQHPKPGELWAWMSSDGHYLVNLFTHDGVYAHGSKPGRAELKHINHSLHALRKFVQKEQVASLALPRLGCGMNGLDWAEVKPLIEHHLGDLGIPLYLYTHYQKGVKADEPAA